jgi:hypothetical protein
MPLHCLQLLLGLLAELSQSGLLRVLRVLLLHQAVPCLRVLLLLCPDLSHLLVLVLLLLLRLLNPALQHLLLLHVLQLRHAHHLLLQLLLAVQQLRQNLDLLLQQEQQWQRP